MVKTRGDLISAVIRYVEELERLGVPVERVLLYGSHSRRQAHEDSDIDLAVCSEAFGAPEYRELSGVLSEAKWNTEPMTEAVGFHPSVLDDVPRISFLNEIARDGKTVYKRRSRREVRGTS